MTRRALFAAVTVAAALLPASAAATPALTADQLTAAVRAATALARDADRDLRKQGRTVRHSTCRWSSDQPSVAHCRYVTRTQLAPHRRSVCRGTQDFRFAAASTRPTADGAGSLVCVVAHVR